MTTGRKPKPHALRLVEGNRSSRRVPPENERMMPPIADGMPKPPAHLHAYAVEEWARVAPDLYALGILTDVDTMALGAYCQAVADWRLACEQLAEIAKDEATPTHNGLTTKSKNGNLTTHPLFNAANRAAEQMLKFAAEFGMTPSARARIDGKVRQGEKDPIRQKYGI